MQQELSPGLFRMMKGDPAPSNGVLFSDDAYKALGASIQNLQETNDELSLALEALDRAIKACIANTEMWKAEAQGGSGLSPFLKGLGGSLLGGGLGCYVATKLGS